MTPKESTFMTFLRRYIAEHNGASPSYEELCQAMGLASKSGIHRLAMQLERRGYIYREAGGRRNIRPLDSGEADRQFLASAMSVASAYDKGFGPRPQDIAKMVSAYRRMSRKMALAS